MFGLNKIIPTNSNYDFMKLKNYFIYLSILLIVISVFLLSFRGLNLGIDNFGKSAPYKDIYKHFELDVENIVQKIKKNL